MSSETTKATHIRVVVVELVAVGLGIGTNRHETVAKQANFLFLIVAAVTNHAMLPSSICIGFAPINRICMTSVAMLNLHR